LICGAKNIIENATKIHAITHDLIQTKIKFALKPKLIDTNTNVTKKVVMLLIKNANLTLYFIKEN
jgi:hypothetical protein